MVDEVVIALPVSFGEMRWGVNTYYLRFIRLWRIYPARPVEPGTLRVFNWGSTFLLPFNWDVILLFHVVFFSTSFLTIRKLSIDR